MYHSIWMANVHWTVVSTIRDKQSKQQGAIYTWNGLGTTGDQLQLVTFAISVVLIHLSQWCLFYRRRNNLRVIFFNVEQLLPSSYPSSGQTTGRRRKCAVFDLYFWWENDAVWRRDPFHRRSCRSKIYSLYKRGQLPPSSWHCYW